MVATRRVARVLSFAAALLVAAGISGAGGQGQQDRAAVQAEVTSTWYRLALELVRHTPGYAPPVASRAFAYLGVTLYEAVAPGIPGSRSLAGQLNGLQPLPRPAAGAAYDWAVAENAALSRAVAYLFEGTGPTGQNASRAIGARLAGEVSAGLEAALVARSVAYGESIAAAVQAWSLGDGGAAGAHESYPTSYLLPQGPSAWVSTALTTSRPLLPYWGKNRPFIAGRNCPIAGPPAYSEAPSSRFYQEALEVYRTSRELTDEQRAIARFWSDDAMLTTTPPGHWIEILGEVLAERGASTALTAEAYARLGIALADAFIACWDVKYKYNLLRPVTLIRRLIDPRWEPLLNTPPFPEYPSGHSVQSAAAAQVMSDLFGEAYAFVDGSREADGLGTRRFSSFWDAAKEAAVSRLYGGIHFRSAIDDGLEQGRCIGLSLRQLNFRQ